MITAARRAAYSATLFIIVATSAEGQSYYREDMVRGVCRKDGCDDFTIDEVKPVSNHGDGSLHSARIGVFHASFRGRVSRGTEEIYVFCSRARPALVQTSFGKYVAYFLAPHGRAREPRETINHYALYFALCHGVEAGKLAAKDKPSIASQFGYRVPLEALRAVNVNAPEEVVRIAPQ